MSQPSKGPTPEQTTDDRRIDGVPHALFEQRISQIAHLLTAAHATGRPPRTIEDSRVQPAGCAGREPSRWQDELIARETPEGASVLDLGCGDGALLQRLIRERRVRGQGMEIDPEAVFACVDRGVPVMQVDLGEGLRRFPDGAFDLVVLEETLQTLANPREMLGEMLRVGRRGIVSFPNFAHWRVIVDLVARGRMPVTQWLPFQWYDTANIHPFTLQDLLDWSRDFGVRVVNGYALENGVARNLAADDNLHAEEVLVVVER